MANLAMPEVDVVEPLANIAESVGGVASNINPIENLYNLPVPEVASGGGSLAQNWFQNAGMPNFVDQPDGESAMGMTPEQNLFQQVADDVQIGDEEIIDDTTVDSLAPEIVLEPSSATGPDLGMQDSLMPDSIGTQPPTATEFVQDHSEPITDTIPQMESVADAELEQIGDEMDYLDNRDVTIPSIGEMEFTEEEMDMLGNELDDPEVVQSIKDIFDDLPDTERFFTKVMASEQLRQRLMVPPKYLARLDKVLKRGEQVVQKLETVVDSIKRLNMLARIMDVAPEPVQRELERVYQEAGSPGTDNAVAMFTVAQIEREFKNADGEVNTKTLMRVLDFPETDQIDLEQEWARSELMSFLPTFQGNVMARVAESADSEVVAENKQRLKKLDQLYSWTLYRLAKELRDPSNAEAAADPATYVYRLLLELVNIAIEQEELPVSFCMVFTIENKVYPIVKGSNIGLAFESSPREEEENQVVTGRDDKPITLNDFSSFPRVYGPEAKVAIFADKPGNRIDQYRDSIKEIGLDQSEIITDAFAGTDVQYRAVESNIRIKSPNDYYGGAAFRPSGLVGPKGYQKNIKTNA